MLKVSVGLMVENHHGKIAFGMACSPISSFFVVFPKVPRLGMYCVAPE